MRSVAPFLDRRNVFGVPDLAGPLFRIDIIAPAAACFGTKIAPSAQIGIAATPESPP